MKGVFMEYGIKRNDKTIENIYDFLNASARAFYDDKLYFSTKKFPFIFKGSLLKSLNEIERVIFGTFNCDIFMKYADYSKLSAMFPHGLELFNVKNQNDMIRVGRFFDILRNANAHAFCDDSDFVIFDYDFSNLELETRFDNNVRYWGESGLTIAGLIFIIMNFLREESLASLTKADILFGIISKGKAEIDKGFRFVEEISHVNLTIPIRTIQKSGVLSSVLAEHASESDDSGSFLVKVGADKAYKFYVKGTYLNDVLFVEKASISKVFYKDDYFLHVVDKEGFVELANQFPCFAFVDLLYLLDVRTFDKNTYEIIHNKMDLYGKLNHPKYYVDKNVYTLTLSEEIGDYRLISSITTSALLQILLDMEGSLIRKTKADLNGRYSRTKDALHSVGVPKNIIQNIVTLRNFVSHGYLFGEYIETNEGYCQYSLEYAIHSLAELAKSFDDISAKMGLVFKEKIHEMFTNRVCSTKYKKCIAETLRYFEDYPRVKNYADLKKKNLSISHSFFNDDIFDELVGVGCNKVSVIRIKLDGEQNDLYIYGSEDQRIIFDVFLKRNNMKIVEEINKAPVSTVLVK